MDVKLTRRQILAGAAGITASCALPFQAMAGGTRRIVVQGGSPSVNTGYIPIIVAQTLGFFAHENLDVHLRFSHGAPLAAQIVNSGGADIGNITYEPLILGYSRGLRGKFYYQFYNKTIYFIGVPRESRIDHLSGLTGKRIGVASLSSAAVPVAKAILKNAGVDPSSVTFLPVGVGGQAYTALRAKRVDALALWDAAFGTLNTLGASFRFFRDSRLESVGNGGYLASDHMLEHRRHDLIGYARACAKATAFFHANPQAAIRIYWHAHPDLKHGANDAEAMKNALAEVQYFMQDIAPKHVDGKAVYGDIDLDEINKYIRIFSASADVANPPKAAQIAAPGFAREINRFDAEKVQKMANNWHA